MISGQLNIMNERLNLNATMALRAFENQDYSGLEQYGNEIYNYFVHNPLCILSLDSPLSIGKVFHVCLGFQEPDEDIQEVRAENAFLCFSEAINSSNIRIHDEACARIMMLLIREQKHLFGKVEQSCRIEGVNPYSFFAVMDDGLPNDMPMATNTKMLFTAFYLYDSIIGKENVGNLFSSVDEKNNFGQVKAHIIDNCNLLRKTSSNRKIELGHIVFEKICERLRKDVLLYANI